ncbi:hypothetical protein ACWGLI_37810, partial [Kitasatospora sp. NPDC054769]
MGLRDWIGRRRGGEGAVNGAASGAASDDTEAARGAGEAARRRPAAGDGGWRAVAPLVPTLAGPAHGVSDGLRFRARLTAWQDPSLCGPLGHAVLPTAPVGILRAVARPGAPAPVRTGGDELVVPVVPSEAGAEEPPENGPSGAARSPRQARPVQRSVRLRRLPVRSGPHPARVGGADSRAAAERADSGVPRPAAATPGTEAPGASVPGGSKSAAVRGSSPKPEGSQAASGPLGAATPEAAAAPRPNHSAVRADRPVRPRPVGAPLVVARRPSLLPARPVAAVPGQVRAPAAVTEPASRGAGAPRPAATTEETAGGTRRPAA